MNIFAYNILPPEHDVEAVQFYGNFEEIEKFVGGDAEFRQGKLVVASRQGALWANPGDYIVKDKKGMFSIMTEEEFEGEYENVYY